MKCMLLDLDETLFDHRHSCRMGISALSELYPILGRRNVEELEDIFWKLLNENYREVLAGRLTADETRFARIAALFTTCEAEAPDNLEELSKIYRRSYDSSMRAVPGIAEVLERLRERGWKTIVITNGFKDIQREKLRACGLEKLIDHVITSKEFGIEKPEPAIFEAALKLCGAKAEEAVMVGDAWEVDIAGALAAGIRPIWLNRRAEPCPCDGVATVIYEPAELLRILDEE